MLQIATARGDREKVMRGRHSYEVAQRVIELRYLE
jgi:hypothetical protein